MKASKYTVLFDISNKEFYVYNTLSNELIEIDEESLLLNKYKQSEIVSA